MPRCPECRDAEFRRDNGCDADADFDLFETSCPGCGRGSVDCTTCNGAGKVGVRRCPASIVTRDAWGLLDSYAQFSEHGTLPVEGGLDDQLAIWHRWMRFIGAERARIDEERRPRSKLPNLPSMENA